MIDGTTAWMYFPHDTCDNHPPMCNAIYFKDLENIGDHPLFGDMDV